MKIYLYSVRDTKIERSNVPYYARNDQEASVILVRSGLPKSIYEDAQLFCVGDFDDETGCLSSFDTGRQVQLPPYPEKDHETL